MIRFKGHEIAAVRYGRRAISAVYKGTRLVWQAVSGLFATRLWIEDGRNWRDDDFWLE